MSPKNRRSVSKKRGGESSSSDARFFVSLTKSPPRRTNERADKNLPPAFSPPSLFHQSAITHAATFFSYSSIRTTTTRLLRRFLLTSSPVRSLTCGTHL